MNDPDKKDNPDVNHNSKIKNNRKTSQNSTKKHSSDKKHGSGKKSGSDRANVSEMKYDPEADCRKMTDRLKKICKERKITQNSLAKESRISNSALSYLLSGKSTPYMYTMLLICHALGITLADLVEKEGDSEKEQPFFETVQSEQEMDLLLHYRNLSDRKKDLLNGYLNMLEQPLE